MNTKRQKLPAKRNIQQAAKEPIKHTYIGATIQRLNLVNMMIFNGDLPKGINDFLSENEDLTCLFVSCDTLVRKSTAVKKKGTPEHQANEKIKGLA